jgi:hypothetical protein
LSLDVVVCAARMGRENEKLFAAVWLAFPSASVCVPLPNFHLIVFWGERDRYNEAMNVVENFSYFPLSIDRRLNKRERERERVAEGMTRGEMREKRAVVLLASAGVQG